ncbi:hypothetical protein T09_14516 [Trichinella sp. T9]|nr:hypothetical protein T09_14516 [Trichinella sp. T9]
MAGNVAISRLHGVALVGKPQSLPSTTDTPPVTGPHP